MTFRVGMKVEVILSPSGATHINHLLPKLYAGQIFTIRDYDTRASSRGFHSIATVRLEEIVAPNRYYEGFGFFEAGYRADCFRPLTDTKSETSFTQGAPKDSEKWDCRRKIPVRERAWGCSAQLSS